MIQVKYNNTLKEIDIISPSLLTDSNDIRIRNYVDAWNRQKDSSIEQLLTETFEFCIVYHSCNDLYNGNEYLFGQDVYKKVPEESSLAMPTIHLTLFDVFGDSDDSLELPDVKRYKKIIDSGIWNYHVPIKVKNKSFDYTRFESALKEISFNTSHKRYILSVASEYADLNARLLEQSHLEGGHKQISPFLFHSENEMHELIKRYEKRKEPADGDIILSDLQKYRWRFLLLDDKGVEKMSNSNSNQQGVDLCKLQIITDNLCRILGFEQGKIWYRIFENAIESNIKVGKVMNGVFMPPSVPNGKDIFIPPNETPQEPRDVQIVIDCVRNVNDAMISIQENKYDIILLDYLLENGEYGYQVLEELSHKDYSPGPNKRFFFMFTSAFTTAVHERILERGFAKSERGLWYIGDGACPTNTPFLFSYQLMLLMRHRVKDLRKENEGSLLSVIDLLEEIYVKKGEAGTEETRQKAHEHFNHVLFMRDKYKTLEKDFRKNDESHLKQHHNDANYILNMESSLLVQSAFKVVNHFSGAFFEHLQHLVYLTAFGTIRQWQDMWEEYVFVSKELCDYDILVNEKVNGKNDEEKLVRRGKAVSEAIREYIINLKENNY